VFSDHTYTLETIIQAGHTRMAVIGLALGARFLYYFFQGDGAGHVQSIVLTALLLGTAFFLSVVAAVADLVSANRKLLERANYRLSKLEEGQRALRDELGEGRARAASRPELSSVREL